MRGTSQSDTLDDSAAGLVVRPALAVYAAAMLVLTAILANGYALNLLNLPADAAVIFILCAIELIVGARWLAGQRVRIAGDPLELAGLLLVVAGTWVYFVIPSLPTLLPPSYSGDGAIHYAFTNRVFTTGWIISDDPGGPSLIAATLAHWVGWLPVTALHTTAALFIALTAGGIYGMACAILPDRREFKSVALFSVLALYAAWSYFAGIALLTNYFFSQIAGQLFVVAFVWFLLEYDRSHARLWEVFSVAALLALLVLYQLWLALAAGLFGWVWLAEWRRGGAARQRAWRIALVAAGAAAVVALAFLLNGRRFWPGLDRLQVDASVFAPSIDNFGGPVMAAIALAGLVLAFGKDRFRVIVAYTLVTVLQTAALFGASVFLGAGKYWLIKSMFLWIFPMALCSAIAAARALELVRPPAVRRALASAAGFVMACCVLGAFVFLVHPPLRFAVFDEPDVQVALWAKANLNTRHVNYIGAKTLAGMWLGTGLWDEQFPGDLVLGGTALGPKTYEEWRDDPGWGEYLFVSDNQHHPIGPAERIIYRRGDSLIVEKPRGPTAAAISDSTPRFGNVFALTDYHLAHATLAAGDTLSLTLQLATAAVPKKQVVWRLQLRDRNNEPVAETRVPPFDNRYPSQRWPDKIALAQSLSLALPQDIAPGVYDVQLGLYQVADGEPQRFASGDKQDDIAHLGRIKIPAPAPTAAELARMTPSDAQVGPSVKLMGFSIASSDALYPGDDIKLDLYWRCLAPATADYTVFVHLIDAQGKLKAQRDAQPRDGTLPTTAWGTGEIVVDPYTLTIPGDAAPGDYTLQVGMYPWPDLTPVPVTATDGRPLGDRVALPVTIHVRP